MIRDLLEPLVCERFRDDARYREGHLRIVNALPEDVLKLYVRKARESFRTKKHITILNGLGSVHFLQEHAHFPFLFASKSKL